MANLLYNMTNFRWSEWPNVKEIIQPSGHTAYELHCFGQTTTVVSKFGDFNICLSSKGEILVAWVQCDQIRLFLKGPDNKFYYKSYRNTYLPTFWIILKNTTTVVAKFLATFGKIGLLFLTTFGHTDWVSILSSKSTREGNFIFSINYHLKFRLEFAVKKIKIKIAAILRWEIKVNKDRLFCKAHKTAEK